MRHPAIHPCAVCGRETSQWCSRCRNVWYCSPDHLASDWQHHRNQCYQAPRHGSNMIATPPPAEPEYISVHAILFLADEDWPRIIKVKYRTQQRPSPLLQSYFDANVVVAQGLNNVPLRFPLHIFYSSTAFSTASPINLSIYRITSGVASKPWYGKVVALKYNGALRHGYTDAGSNDFPALSAYFLSYD